MRRIKPVFAVAAIVAAIFGERWLRHKTHLVV
jgi:hypothetical protein